MTRGLHNRAMWGLVVAVALAAVLVVLLQPSPVRAAAAQSPSGAQLYAQHCSSCHQPTGLGVSGTFPPLAGNPAAEDPEKVESAIVDGVSGTIEVLGVSYSTAMPPVAALSDPADIAAVVQYVVEISTRVPTDSVDDEEPAEPIVPNADRGHDLFIGANRFDNGGGACASCHTAGSVGNLGGPGLGPDLTNVFSTLGGDVGLTGWLGNPPSATMQPLFSDRPLTEAEVADLVAFLDDATGQDRASSSVDRLTLIGIAGVAALMAGMAVMWRGMRQTYLERLRSTRKPALAARSNR